MTERKALMQRKSSAIAAFRAAERAYHQSLGVAVAEHDFAVPGMGISARYLEVGEGPAVVMVHGGGGLASGWTPMIPHLPGFRLILPDRPGFGLSGYVDYRTVDLREHAIQFLQAVMDDARVETAQFVANSMGALWTLWLAQAHPSRVDGMVLLGTPARILETTAPGGMRLLGVPGLNRLMMALEPPSVKQVHTLWRRMGHDPDRVCSAEMVELVIRAEQLPMYKDAWLSLLRNVLPFARKNPRVGFGETDLAGLTQDVLYVWGTDDPFGSLDVARRSQSLTARSKLEVIGVGHLPWLDEPEQCSRVTREFLGRAF